MKLYYFPGTIASAVAIALHEADIGFELQLVDFKTKAQTQPEYHRINPKGRVPALETDDGILTETGAILEYIAAIKPAAALMPAAPGAAARVRAVMYYLASTMHINHAHGRRASRWADLPESKADMRAKIPQNMTDSAGHVEEHCLVGPFILGDQITVGDAYLFTACAWLEQDGVDVSAFPRILAFRKAMEARGSVQAVRAAGMF